MNKHRFIQLTKDTPRNEYGGKADGLIELVSLGFEVPDALLGYQRTFWFILSI